MCWYWQGHQLAQSCHWRCQRTDFTLCTAHPAVEERSRSRGSVEWGWLRERGLELRREAQLRLTSASEGSDQECADWPLWVYCTWHRGIPSVYHGASGKSVSALAQIMSPHWWKHLREIIQCFRWCSIDPKGSPGQPWSRSSITATQSCWGRLCWGQYRSDEAHPPRSTERQSEGHLHGSHYRVTSSDQ